VYREKSSPDDLYNSILVSGLEGGTPMKITRSESIIVIIVPEIIKQTSGIAF